jgi:phosphatidylinositol alpha-mannosyltransferase
VNVGTFHAYRESNAMYEYMRPLLQRVFNRLDGRIFVSEVVRDYITRYFPGDATIIPNGIDCERFDSSDIEPIQQFCDGRPNILFVGRMEKRKGFRYLIRAFPYIKKAVPDARLIVVGAFSDAEKAPFLRYARTHRLRAVHFVGYVAPEELPRYYRTANLFCAPSTGNESFGIILLEAMAAGLPIVATDIAGYRQVVENGRDGILVPPTDEYALARAATSLLKDPGRCAEMGRSARIKAAQYDWSIIAQRVLAYYDELIAAQPTPGTKPHSSAGMRRIVRVRHLLDWRRIGRRKRVPA